MLKQLKDLSNVRTEVLFVQAKLTHSISVLSSIIATFAATLMLFTMKSHSREMIAMGLAGIGFLVLIAVIADLQFSKKILTELKKRCGELPSQSDKADYTEEYRRQRKWGALSIVSLFLAFAIYFKFVKAGVIKPTKHFSLEEFTQFLLIALLMIPTLLFSLLRIRCPACKRFIPRQFENKQGTCPHCGVKLK